MWGGQNERRPEVPGDFDMILQNAEGIKNKFISLTLSGAKQCDWGAANFADAINNDSTPIVTLEQATEALESPTNYRLF
jgi:hypothetical protein